jgi:hypothetical protein
MGVPTSEVGFTSATTGRHTTKSVRDMWWHWERESERNYNYVEKIKIGLISGKIIWHFICDFVLSLRETPLGKNIVKIV